MFSTPRPPRLHPVIRRIEEIRKLQKSYFASRAPDLLVRLRAGEELLRAELDGVRVIDPDQWHAIECARAMLRDQRAWIDARGHLWGLERDGAPAEAVARARDLAGRLQGQAQASERRTDKAIESLLSPSLPGLGE